MPEVIRGSRTRSFEQGPPTHPTTPSSPHAETPVSPFSHDRRVTFDRVESQASSRLTPVNSAQRAARGTRNSKSFERTRRKERASIERVEQDAYYDSRAATKREFQRRASTLQSYYHDHPYLLPQLPFTFRHGFKRWKLAGYIVLIIIDACVIPIVLYYTMTGCWSCPRFHHICYRRDNMGRANIRRICCAELAFDKERTLFPTTWFYRAVAL